MFAPGDEVVCVDASTHGSLQSVLSEGAVYTVVFVGLSPWGDVGLILAEVKSRAYRGGFMASRFRKVQRRNLTEWLATENTIEEPKRAPAKKRERV